MRRTLTFILECLFVIAVCLPITSSRCGSTPEQDEKEALGKSAITACVANVNSFPFCKCRYRITKAQARSVEDAIRGHFLNARFYDNRLLVKGDKDLCEGFAPPPDWKQARDMGGGNFIVPSPGNSNRYLSDGKREMNYCPPLETASLFSAETNKCGIDITPLGFLVGHRNSDGPDTWLRQPDRFEFSSDGLQEVDGRPVVTVRFKVKKVFQPGTPDEIAFAHVLSFDPSRGYLPIRKVTLWNGKPKIQVFVTDIRECSKQRWFPERMVRVDTPDKENDLYDVSEIKLFELDVDKPPEASEFAVVVPGGTYIADAKYPNGKHWFKLKQDEKIRMEDLPKLFEMTEKAAVTPLMDTAIPQRDSYAWLRWLGGIAGILLALGGVIVLIRRLRLRRA